MLNLVSMSCRNSRPPYHLALTFYEIFTLKGAYTTSTPNKVCAVNWRPKGIFSFGEPFTIVGHL